MKINLDDPQLTAYALDELSGAERERMKTAVASSPEAQEFVRMKLALKYPQCLGLSVITRIMAHYACTIYHLDSRSNLK